VHPTEKGCPQGRDKVLLGIQVQKRVITEIGKKGDTKGDTERKAVEYDGNGKGDTRKANRQIGSVH